VAITAILLGLPFTGYCEWQNVYVKHAWAYAPLTPTVGIGGVAIGFPLTQWVIVPALTFWQVHRGASA
jgi:hypothetical protein